MKILTETYKNTGDIHHAYILEGEKAGIRPQLLSFIEEQLAFPIQANPDFWHQTFETFSIDDARKLQDLQLMKPIVHSRKIFIIEMLGMTSEAQNALLKIFEEPHQGTHFFILLDSAELLLPTLRSRMVTVRNDDRSEESQALAKKFMNASVADRLALVASIVEEKDKAQATALVDGLIVLLSAKNVSEHASVLKELLELRGFLADRSPSLKLILEHIAVTLPSVK